MKLSEYIETLKGKSVAVIGAGVSNLPLIRLLNENDIDLTVCDKRDEKALKENGIEFPRNLKLQLGEDYLEDLYQEIIFRTPGLMPFEEHLVKAKERGSLITSEMEVFFSVCPCRTVAITGSDGKTTTSTLIALLLKEAGYKVHLGGNIGNPLLCEADSFGKDDFAVLELSSFQLHSMKCSPDVAVITNISPNHLDKHKDYQDYIDAKKNIFLNQKKDALLILNKNDGISSRFDSLAPSKVRWFSISDKLDNGFYLDGDDIIGNIDGKTEFIMKASDIVVPGRHNVMNSLTAFAAVNDFVSKEDMVKVMTSFRGVEHRLETFAVHKGIRYINDSIGSSPSRTHAGLISMPKKPVVICGGYDKKIPFDTLGDDLNLYAKKVFLTGHTADKIREAAENSKFRDENVPVTVIDDFDECVTAAAGSAEEGDIVLFSPACASFDRFRNFDERGKHFKKIIMEYISRND